MATGNALKKEFEKAGKAGLLLCYRGYAFAGMQGLAAPLRIVQVFVKNGRDHWVFRMGSEKPVDVEVSEDGKVPGMFGKSKGLEEMARAVRARTAEGIWKFGRSIIIRSPQAGRLYAGGDSQTVRNVVEDPHRYYNVLVTPALLELVNVEGVSPAEIAKKASKASVEVKKMFGKKKENVEAGVKGEKLMVTCGGTSVGLPLKKYRMEDILVNYKRNSGANIQVARAFATLADPFLPGLPFMLIGNMGQNPAVPDVEITGDKNMALRMSGVITTSMGTVYLEKMLPKKGKVEPK